MTRLEKALAELAHSLRELGVTHALVGGLAVSVRAEPRTTRDIDVVVAVATDAEAERVTSRLRTLGYGIGEFLEETTSGRLSTVRITTPQEGDFGVVVDLIFFSSGLEQGIASRAEELEVAPGVVMPVAKLEDLLVTKVLAGRYQDFADVHSLLAHASVGEREVTLARLQEIERLDLNRGADLVARWRRLTREYDDGRA